MNKRVFFDILLILLVLIVTFGVSLFIKGVDQIILMNIVLIVSLVFSVYRRLTGIKEQELKIKQLIKEREDCLKEVNHRIKNNMTVAGSMIMLQSYSLEDPIAIKALESAEFRIRIITLLYNQLYQSKISETISMSEYVSEIIDQILMNDDADIIEIKQEIENIQLDVKKIQCISIIISELVTNSIRHSFNGISEKKIYVSLKKKEKNVQLIVQDNGIGIPESISLENSTGFGLKLVDTFSQQLEAQINVDRTAGTKITVEFEI